VRFQPAAPATTRTSSRLADRCRQHGTARLGVDVGAEAAGPGLDGGDVDLRLEQDDGQGNPGEGEFPPWYHAMVSRTS
jgi:hypothetical protein